MRITYVQLRDFRSYARGEAYLGAGLTVIHGPNGVGKTNLLEAIYFGCTGRSIRTSNEREMVRFGSDATRVVVHTSSSDGPHELSVGYGLLGDPRPTKRMRFDGVDVERLIDLPTRPLMSVFLPDRLELIKGRPSSRRSHMDQLVAALWPLRRARRLAYSRALLQRNALLAGIRTGRCSHATLSSWDHELARNAIALRADRASAVDLVAEHFASRAAQLGLAGSCSLEYQPSSRVSSEDEFVLELEQRLAKDLQRGYGTYGPHRDEIVLLRDGLQLRTYGSQGEQRLALLSLLLAERDVIADMREHPPVMLLDDVMSELDADRREFLISELAHEGQALITTTDLSHVPVPSDTPLTCLNVSGGTIFSQVPPAEVAV